MRNLRRVLEAEFELEGLICRGHRERVDGLYRYKLDLQMPVEVHRFYERPKMRPVSKSGYYVCNTPL